MKRRFLFVICGLFLTIIISLAFIKSAYAKDLNIDDVLQTKSYSELSPIVKKFIKDYYEENGIILLTKDLAKDGEAYLNPYFIKYLESENKDGYGVIPSVTTYTPQIGSKTRNTKSRSVLPSKFDLRDVDGKNFVTPNKDQGNEGLCWGYATISLLETHDLIVKDKSYDLSAVLFSEKQMDYALSNNGIIGGNMFYNSRQLSTGADLYSAAELLARKLGGVQNTWNTENSEIINVNGELPSYIVFNRNRSIYEVDETVHIHNINENPTNVEQNENMRNYIKDVIYNYGGAVISVNASNFVTNNLSPNKDKLRDYKKHVAALHAVHLVGWDDNYQYGYCLINSEISLPGVIDSNSGEMSCDEYLGPAYANSGISSVERITGTGAWILKNSWSAIKYFYLTYDSIIDELFFVKKYSENSDSYSFKTTQKDIYKNNIRYTNYYVDNEAINNDILTKIKVGVVSPATIDLYYSEDGNDDSLVLIDSVTFDFEGFKTIDLSGRNIHINSNSYFQVNNSSNQIKSIYLFKKNDGNIKYAYTGDYEYDFKNESPSGGKSLNITLRTDLNNINDNEVIDYKIKDSNNNYLAVNSYEIFDNISYYNMVTPIISIGEDYAKKGVYTIETWKDSELLCSSIIELKNDYVSINGAGTEEDPWQVTNTRHFNMIRNAPSDYYKLMNDIDFYYDTQAEGGLFYSNGWPSIVSFYGNLDGNGKTIKNIKANSGLFDTFELDNNGCKFSKCGVHDLTVDSLISNCSGSVGGGVINKIVVYESYKVDFNNLSVTNANFTMDSTTHGCIAGSIFLNEYKSNSRSTTIKTGNWYCDATYVGKNVINIPRVSKIGGLVGSIEAINNGDSIHISFNNVKSNLYLNLKNDRYKTYYISDLIEGIYIDQSKVSVNNAIGNIEIDTNENITVHTNAFVNEVEDGSSGSIQINGVRSTLSYQPLDLINITNYEDGLKSYEIAHSNYENINYYESQSDVSTEQFGNAAKIAFTDKFNVYDNMIPTLKKYPEKYTTYYQFMPIRVGDSKTINDLIKTDTNHHKFNVYKSFNCNLDVCNSITDETVITVPTEANEYKFMGLKPGTTTLIIYDKISGYLDTVEINVLESDEYVLSLDYNYDNIIESNYVVKTNTTYGNLPMLVRDGYTFLGWYTDIDDGVKIESNSIFTGNSNITLYAHWKEQVTSYTVSFDSNGGSSVASQTINYNAKATKPSNPTREGYTFKKWLLNGSEYNFNTAVTSNITLTAEWEINKYTVAFDSDGGSSVASQTINYNAKATKPSNPTREGYTFKKWLLNGSEYNFNTVITSNITLTAEWAENTVPSDETLKELLQDNGYNVSSNYVSKFKIGDSIATIKSKLGNNVTIETDKTIIATGTVIRKGNESYTVVIKGDLNGDGKANSGDLLQMRKYLLEEINLTGAYKQAGIIESVGNIKSLDLLRLRQYLLGEYIFK